VIPAWPRQYAPPVVARLQALVAGVEVAKHNWIESAGREGGNFKDDDQKQ